MRKTKWLISLTKQSLFKSPRKTSLCQNKLETVSLVVEINLHNRPLAYTYIEDGMQYLNTK